jgi:hypothetical protein
VPEAGESWSLSVDMERISPDSSDLLVGAVQVKRLCQVHGFLIKRCLA